jgi:riboflavin kinase/FMN adenylyltransferase
MNVLSQISELSTLPGPLHLAIGVFDGLHIGHQKVIQTAIDAAEKSGGTAAVMTFDPHPICIVCPDRAPRLLASLHHKIQLLESFGIEHLLVQTFDQEFSERSADNFVDQLVAAAQPLSKICVGSDWRFGQHRQGDCDFLRAKGALHGFTVDGIEPVHCDQHEVISSTRIRAAIQTRDFATAKRLLGREYTVLGKVIQGRQLGRTIGFPTANLKVFNEELPPKGVYAVEAKMPDGTLQRGVANLGVRPTIEGTEARLLLEVHLFDFSQDIYDLEIEIFFRKFLREEKKFESLDALKAQIAQDAAAAKASM